MFTLFFTAFFVIILAGILSMIEAALFSYSIPKARLYASEGKWLSKRALLMRENPLKTIAALVILSTAVSIGGSLIVGYLASREFSDFGIGVFSAVLIFFSIIISEIIPKNIGERWNYIIFPAASIPLGWFTVILSPIIWLLEIATKSMTSGESPFMTSEEEIAFLTKVGAKEGTIKAREAEMIQRVFKLNDVTAGDIMTPKPFVSFLDGEKTIKQLEDFIKNSKHSRIPVFRKSINNIIGVVHQRDLLRALSSREFNHKISDYAREAMVVPESRLADDLLKDFQEKRNHLAVVVSELVGEIIDEKDVAPEFIKRVSKNEIIAHGQTRIVSINHFFNTEIKSRKSLNGFLLEKFGSVPEVGRAFDLNGLTFQIEEVDRSQIKRVRILKKI